jgi:hypothetical protein
VSATALRILDYRSGLTDPQRQRLAHLLAQNQRPPSSAETLEELERDTRAGGRRDQVEDYPRLRGVALDEAER